MSKDQEPHNLHHTKSQWDGTITRWSDVAPRVKAFAEIPITGSSTLERVIEKGKQIIEESETGGRKEVKPQRYDLIPVEALEKVAELYGRGAEKYAAHNWRKGYEWSKSYAALQRHANAFWRGEDIDPEMELPHMACVAFHALTLIIFMEEHPDYDDRYKGDSDG